MYKNKPKQIKEEETRDYTNHESGLIEDLIERICLNLIDWTSVDKRNISVLIFAVLRKFNVARKSIDNFLDEIDCFTGETCLFWFEKYMRNDYSGMETDGRRQKHGSALYTQYPDIERLARVFAFERCSAKAANFNVQELASFITTEYLKLSNDESLSPNELIRSVSMCREDLIRWGCTHGENKQVKLRVLFILEKASFIDSFILSSIRIQRDMNEKTWWNDETSLYNSLLVTSHCTTRSWKTRKLKISTSWL